MTEEVEEGPDPNDVRRHARRMHTELEYRQKYRRLDFYRPNEKQRQFHDLAVRERMLRAGNQNGKTHAAGAEMAMQAVAWWPDWHQGWRHRKQALAERPTEFLGWAACTTSVMTRDGVQTKLLGDISNPKNLGTGLIPLDNLSGGRVAMARGIDRFVDNVSFKRETGGDGIIRFKTYEMGRQAFQTEPVDVVWLDEDPGRDDAIYGECLARLTTTRGRIMASLTPAIGVTPIRKRFKERAGGDCQEVLMTIYDAAVSKGGHIPDEDIAGIIAGYKASERATRAFGADMQGEGAVFETPVERIKYAADPAAFPEYWRWLWALDFSHSGNSEQAHPSAAVLLCLEPDVDVVRVVHAVRMRALAPMLVAAVKSHPYWEAPVAWPHDGGRSGNLLSGETIAAMFKRLGLQMRPTHATFKDGGYNFEAGVTDMDLRFASKRLLVAGHLTELLDEYQGYHRENGLVVKVDDDLLSAVRVGVMDIRFAQPMHKIRERMAARRGGAEGAIAKGTNFNPFDPSEDE